MADRPGEFTVSEDTLCCPICFEVYQKPKTLNPCMHTFCAKCLHSHLSQSASAWVSPGTVFKCPVCRGHVSIVRTTKTGRGGTPMGMQEVVDSLQGNHIIQTLLDARARSTKSKKPASSISDHPMQDATNVRCVPAAVNIEDEHLATSSLVVPHLASSSLVVPYDDPEEENPELDQETLEVYMNTNPGTDHNPKQDATNVRCVPAAVNTDGEHLATSSVVVPQLATSSLVVPNDDPEEENTELDQETLEVYMNTNPGTDYNPVSLYMEFTQVTNERGSIEILEHTGPSHAPIFTVAAVLGKKRYPSVKASSKALGKQRAACVALNVILSKSGSHHHHLKLLLNRLKPQQQNSPSGKSLLDEQKSNLVKISAAQAVPIHTGSNPVSTLNEYAQTRGLSIKYELVSKTGPPHNPVFEMCIVLGDKQLPVVKVHSMKKGRVQAALSAIAYLNNTSIQDDTAETRERPADPDARLNDDFEALLLKYS